MGELVQGGSISLDTLQAQMPISQLLPAQHLLKLSLYPLDAPPPHCQNIRERS